MTTNPFNLFGNTAVTTRAAGIGGISLATLLMLAPMAFAANVQFTRDSAAAAAAGTMCSVDESGNLNCSGSIKGAGDSPTAFLTATVEANFDCFNPAGQGPNRGHSGPSSVSGPAETLVTKSGTSQYDLSIFAPTNPDTINGKPAEPNSGWTCELTSITYTNVKLHVQTVSGEFVLNIAGTFTGP